MLLGARGRGRAVGQGQPSTSPVGAWGQLCTHTGHVSIQLCSQLLLPEMPKTRVSAAGHRRSRAKDTCWEHE